VAIDLNRPRIPIRSFSVAAVYDRRILRCSRARWARGRSQRQRLQWRYAFFSIREMNLVRLLIKIRRGEAGYAEILLVIRAGNAGI
jgi:hypothetical protein